MTYKCLQRQTFKDDRYEIVPIRLEDMSSIKEWRNEQIAVLRQSKPLTDQDQSLYWENVLEPTFMEEKPKQILFTFLKDGRPIGYGGLTNLDWDSGRGEVSFLLETSRTEDKTKYQAEFKTFLGLLKDAAFNDLEFHRLFTETYDLRPEHIVALEDFGFKLEGTLKDHVNIEGKYCDSLIHGLVRNE